MLPRSADPTWLDALVDASLDAMFIAEPITTPIAGPVAGPVAELVAGPVAELVAEVTDFRILFANVAGAAQFGMTPAQLVGRTLNEVSPPFVGAFRSELIKAHLTGETVRGLTSVIAPQITARKAEYQMVPFGGLIAVAATDRTSEQIAESESETLRRVLAADIDSSLTASALLRPITDDSGSVIDVAFERANELVATMFGVDAQQIVGTTLYSLVERRTGGIIALIEECFRSRRTITSEYDARASSIQPEWIRVQLTAAADFVIMHAEDISQQRREEEMLRAIVENAEEMISVTDEAGLMRYTNPYITKKLGWPREELIGRPMTHFAALHDQEDLRSSFSRLKAGVIPSDRRKIEIVDRNGSTHTTIGSVVSLFTPAGQFDGVVTIAADITDRIESEEARNELAAALGVAEQQERGRLAGDIHDGPVQRLAALSMQLGAATHRSPEAMSAVLLAAEEAVIESIKELRTLMFQLSPPDLEGEGLAQAIRNRAEMLFHDTATTVVVKTEISSPPGRTVAVTLFRLAQEALVNARKHANARQVNVRLYEQRSAEFRLGDQINIVLEIVDDGTGADPERYAQDAPGHLGVNMIFDRARQLGGRAEIVGSPGRGTVVKITLPRS
jgi:PAS domain S-box-containing protein